MSESKPGILPLVGRVLRERVRQVRQEAKEEIRQGLTELRAELMSELEEAEAASRTSEPAPSPGSEEPTSPRPKE